MLKYSHFHSIIKKTLFKRLDAHRNVRPAGLVDAVHMLAELRSVAVTVSVVLSHKQQCVNHLMEESL